MKTRLLISSSMTPAERALGRYLRAPDGHPEGDMVDVPEEEELASTPTKEGDTPSGKSIEDQYNDEFGGVDPAASEDGQGDDGEDGSEESPPAQEPKEKGALSQKDFDELAARTRQLERDLEESRRAARSGEPPKEETVSEEAKAPDPADYEFGAADEKFIADNARWHAEQRFNELQENSRIEAKLEAIEGKWKGALNSDPIKEAFPDFDEKVTKGADLQKWACSPTMAVLIKNSDVGPHVAYELASNADESRRIAALTPEEQLLEFGRLEGRALAKQDLAKEAAPAKRTTGAPPPPAQRSRGNGGKFASPQDALYSKMLSEFN